MGVEVLEDVWTFQAVREHEFLVAKQVGGRAVRYDQSVVQHDGALAELDNQFKVVRGDEFRGGNLP